MRIHNTLSGRKEELQTLNENEVRIYVCGPTTYNLIHLGNARPLVVFDTLRRYLSYRGYRVIYVQNFTDVDDKIINRAREEEVDALELSHHYIDEYFVDADRLGIMHADIHPQVSDHMNDIIDAVGKLIERGYAYEIDGDVYFRVRAFDEYGKLSKRSLDDMRAGARIAVDERKQDPLDFALWKKAKAGEPAWDSPWGNGRPGWHIECSVMSTKYLGETFDIHGGGMDLIFPHHENEIAQAEAMTGQTFVNYWMHNGFITINQEKMSKSLGNFFVLREILAKYPADVVRFYLIATHYRSPLDFDDGKLEEARRALTRLKNSLQLGEEFIQGDEAEAAELDEQASAFLAEINSLETSFIEAMDDDLNTAMAIGHLFEIAHTLNSFLASAPRSEAGNRTAVSQALQTFRSLGDVLGIFMEAGGAEKDAVEGLLEILLQLRSQARQEKNFALADEIRDVLSQHEVRVEDGPEGSRARYEKEPEARDLVEILLSIRSGFKADKQYLQADWVRDRLMDKNVIIEDTREGVRWKFADA